MKVKISLILALLTSCICFWGFKSANAPVALTDYLSMKRADSIVRNLFTDLPSDQGLWYSQVDFLRSQAYILDYYKRSNATAATVGTSTDSLAFMNTAVTGKGKLILTSWVKKSRATATSPITIDNFAVSLYMETAELAVYLNWIKDLSQFATYRIKSQVTPFDETWGLVENGPKFQYYTVTFKVLNNYMLNAPQVTSYKPITYSVELRRFYKP